MTIIYEWLMFFLRDMVIDNTADSLYPIVGQNFEDYPFYKELQKNGGYGGNSSTDWTDVFLYWRDQVEVAEGAILSFFSDLNPNKTEQSVCFK